MRDLIDVILDGSGFAQRVAAFQHAYQKSLEQTLGSILPKATPKERLLGLCHVVRHLLMNRWIDTQAEYHERNVKRLYYLSMEYLLGRLVKNALINLDLVDVCKAALEDLGLDMDELLELEPDPGLGNGGLGRLAACFLDSLSTLSLPVYGYGIRYEFGMFKQVISQMQQKELPDPWLRYGYPLEVEKQVHSYEVGFGGEAVFHEDQNGHIYSRWTPSQVILASPHDLPVPGFGTDNVNTLRLWSAESNEDFHFSIFNAGDFVGAVMKKVESEALSKVLYPNDSNPLGKALRLKQEYFLVSASLQDIMRRFKSANADLEQLPDKIVLQMNDTHPTLAVPELMRLLMDVEHLPWDKAWALTQKTIAFTNHTVMPEAMETWPVDMLREILPRHLQIIEEINRRFVASLRSRAQFDQAFIERVAIISYHGEAHVRMANMAVVASFSVNGVAALHTELLKSKIFPEFNRLYPKRFNNKTNGISPRRWLALSNPALAGAINEAIGDSWHTQLDQLKKLERFADDSAFHERLEGIRARNKEHLAQLIQAQCKESIDPKSIFDVQVKRIHEYKRQLLKLLECIHAYHELRDNFREDTVPRTVIFAGKAAPGYLMAKQVIQLIHHVAAVINNDPLTRDRLKLVFLPNYNVSLAETIIPAADLSQQISTAGTEASGTGNMKFCLNGAVIVGTLDGANIEIKEHVGDDQIYIFGHTVESLHELQARGYRPMDILAGDEGLGQVINSIRNGFFSRGDRDRYKSIVDSLLVYGDRFFHVADFGSYVKTMKTVSADFQNRPLWQRKSLLNLARVGWFSSDRTIEEYNRDIWGLERCSTRPRPPTLKRVESSENDE